MNTGPLGSELTKEPFQWDQRLFAFVLVLPATSSSSLTTQTSSLNPAANAGITDTSANQFIPAAHDQPITAMCDVAGGWEELNIRKSKKSFFFFIIYFRSVLFNHNSTSSIAMFGISCTKNSSWSRCQSRKSSHRRYEYSISFCFL
jgi:hypothetical protein